MRANSPLKVQFKLTDQANELARRLNISLGLESNDSFTSVFYLRSISFESISIKPKDIKIINTGIHIIVTDPFYEVCVSSYMNILKNKGLAVFPCSYYKYGNELQLLMYNYSEESQTIIPAEKIALLSFKEIVLVETENIEEISNEDYYILSNLMKNTDHLYNPKDHSWVQKEKIVSKVKNVLNTGVFVDQAVAVTESMLTRKSSGSNLLNDMVYNLACFSNNYWDLKSCT